MIGLFPGVNRQLGRKGCFATVSLDFAAINERDDGS